MSLNENNQPGKKALNDEFLKKAVEEGNNRSGKVKNGWFLRVGHCNPDHSSSPSNCTTIGYSEADGLSWLHLLPNLYFPESLFPGPKKGAGVTVPQVSPGRGRSCGGTDTALPSLLACLWETQDVLTKASCLRLEKNCPHPPQLSKK